MTNKIQRLNETLAMLVDEIPRTYFAVLSNMDGIYVASSIPDLYQIYKNPPPEIEQRLTAINAATEALSSNVAHGLAYGSVNFVVLHGDRSSIFFIVLADEYVLSLGVRDPDSIDGVLEMLQRHWLPIFEILGIPRQSIW